MIGTLPPERYSMRGPALLGLAALLAFVVGFGLWATRATLAGAVIVDGTVEEAAGRHVLQHATGGPVREVLVRDGDSVAAGDILLRLDDRALRSDLRIVTDRLTDLAAREARLIAERDGLDSPEFPPALSSGNGLSRDIDHQIAHQIDGQTRLFAARRATLAQAEAQLRRRIAQLQAQGAGLLVQRDALETQLALIAQETAAQQGLLSKGLVAQTTVLALRREAARLTGQIGEVAATLARTAEQVTEVEGQISALYTRQREEAAAELRDIGPLILELEQTRRALLDQIDGLTLRAPAAGTVLGLAALAPDAVLRPAEPALTIVPQASPVIVMARIPPRQIDAVSVGQMADLVPAVLPAADRLRLRGRVTVVSADTLVDPRTGVPHYLARLELQPGEAGRLPDPALIPGLPVEVFLLTGDRTALSYLLQPFSTYFSRALREG